MSQLSELLQMFNNLSPEDQQTFKREAFKPQGVKGSELNERLQKFKGKLNLSSADYDKMMGIIEEDCQ